MRFSTIASILCFLALSFAAPLMNAVAERSYDIDGFDAREWIGLEPRAATAVNKFHKGGPGVDKAANAFIDSANRRGQLALAATPGSSSKTTKSDGTFHLDRQQPTNAQGQYKVAVQLNRVNKGAPSVLGEVAIHRISGHPEPSSNRVAKRLKYSVRAKTEIRMNDPDSKKAQNIAANLAKQQAKAARNQAKHRAGMKQAARGEYKKGRKQKLES